MMAKHVDKNWERFYGSYISTYIQRDAREFLNINDTAAFHKFMQVAATRVVRHHLKVMSYGNNTATLITTGNRALTAKEFRGFSFVPSEVE